MRSSRLLVRASVVGALLVSAIAVVPTASALEPGACAVSGRLVDPAGAPLAGAALAIPDPDSAFFARAATATTGADGTFELAVDPGYADEVDAPSRLICGRSLALVLLDANPDDLPTGNSVVFRAAASGVTALGDVVHSSTAIISGTGASARLLDDSGAITAEAIGEDDAFAFTLLRPGRVALSVDGRGYAGGVSFGRAAFRTVTGASHVAFPAVKKAKRGTVVVRVRGGGEDADSATFLSLRRIGGSQADVYTTFVATGSRASLRVPAGKYRLVATPVQTEQFRDAIDAGVRSYYRAAKKSSHTPAKARTIVVHAGARVTLGTWTAPPSAFTLGFE